MEKREPLPVVTFRARPEFVEVLTEAAVERQLSRSALIRLAICNEVQQGRRAGGQQNIVEVQSET